MQKLTLLSSLARTMVAAACGGASAEEGVLLEGEHPDEVAALDYDPAAERLLRAHPHALYQSRDGGDRWDPIPLPVSARTGEVAAVSTPAGDSALCIARPGLVVMRGEDQSETWVALNEGLPSRDVQAFTTHLAQPGTRYAFIPWEGVFPSEYAGKAWTRMDAGPGGPVAEVFHSNIAGSMHSAVILSEDGGETWEQVSPERPEKVALTVDPAGALYAATRDGGALLRCVDRGRTWTGADA